MKADDDALAKAVSAVLGLDRRVKALETAIGHASRWADEVELRLMRLEGGRPPPRAA